MIWSVVKRRGSGNGDGDGDGDAECIEFVHVGRKVVRFWNEGFAFACEDGRKKERSLLLAGPEDG